VDEQAEAVERRNADAAWAEVCAHLRDSLSETTFNTFFAQAEATFDEDALVVTVLNNFVRSWIENHFVDLIQDVVGEGRRVRVTVETLEEPPPEVGKSELHRVVTAGVKDRYTFDSFVTGSSNRFAYAAALAVAEAPAHAYNPLFIYGGTGLGKTHLLQSIARYVRDNSSPLSVRYLTSETFLNDFINSLRDKRIDGFKQRYRTYDLLLVDDVQFFEGKEQIQVEFFHTFNSLYETGHQIVMSSDRPPRDLATLEERLRSRFEWGLITDIQPPDLETRIAILQRKVETDRLDVQDPEVLTLIAERLSGNIRALEGAITRVSAFASLTCQPMTVGLAQTVLQDATPRYGSACEVSIQRIKETVSEWFSVSPEELGGPGRAELVAYPRQIAMYLCRELTDSSLAKIGMEFGGRDHTTIMYATSKIGRLIGEKREVYNLVQNLTARVRQPQ
jgi:chromosomal replication initiator protein